MYLINNDIVLLGFDASIVLYFVVDVIFGQFLAVYYSSTNRIVKRLKQPINHSSLIRISNRLLCFADESFGVIVG